MPATLALGPHQYPGLYYVDVASYLSVPHEMLLHHTRALLAAGKIDEALRNTGVSGDHAGERRTGQRHGPGTGALGRKKEADELFTQAWTAYTAGAGRLPEQPDGPPLARRAGHGLPARTRPLADVCEGGDQADPKSPAFRKALAEVHFRRSDRTTALDVMTALAAEFPRNDLSPATTEDPLRRPRAAPSPTPPTSRAGVGRPRHWRRCTPTPPLPRNGGVGKLRRDRVGSSRLPVDEKVRIADSSPVPGFVGNGVSSSNADPVMIASDLQPNGRRLPKL